MNGFDDVTYTGELRGGAAEVSGTVAKLEARAQRLDEAGGVQVVEHNAHLHCNVIDQPLQLHFVLQLGRLLQLQLDYIENAGAQDSLDTYRDSVQMEWQ